MATGVEELLDMLFEMVDEAKNAAFSNDKCIIERDRALDLIDGGKIDVFSMVYACKPLDKLPEIRADGKLRARGKFIITP